MGEMLKFVNVTKVYPEEIPVTGLDKLNLVFDSTGLVSVVGPSGCGKTTLLNIIGGLESYDGGDLLINGVSTSNYTSSDFDAYRASFIGFIPQSCQSGGYALSAFDYICLPLKLVGVSKGEQTIRTRRAVREGGLQGHDRKPISNLSAGERQRLEIARAIVKDPKIILADEPTGNMDDVNARQIMQLFKEISKTCLVIVVTHNKLLAEEFSDRIIHLRDGRVERDQKFPKPPVTDLDEEARIAVAMPLPNTKPRRRKAMGFVVMFDLAVGNLVAKGYRIIALICAMMLGVIAFSLSLALIDGVAVAIGVISLCIVAIMLGIVIIMSIAERKNELGNLRALGVSKPRITAMLFLEYLITAVMSGVFGVFISWLILWVINYMG